MLLVGITELQRADNINTAEMIEWQELYVEFCSAPCIISV